MTPAVGVGTNIGMNTMSGMGMDPTGMAGLGMTAGLGLNASSGLAPDVSSVMGLGSAATAAAPPIATECLLVSNLFDPNKLALCSITKRCIYISTVKQFCVFL